MAWCPGEKNVHEANNRNVDPKNIYPIGLFKVLGDFPGGAAVKNPPASAGDMGSIPGPGRSHMPQSN